MNKQTAHQGAPAAVRQHASAPLPPLPQVPPEPSHPDCTPGWLYVK